MKQLLLAFAIITTASLHAQSRYYNDNMKEYTALYDSSKTAAEYQQLSISFLKIAGAEKTQWLPYYYAALTLLNRGWLDGAVNKDSNSAAVNLLLDKAESLTASTIDKAEIYVLREVAATQQMMVDPMARYQTFGPKAAAALEKAKELDSSNQRIYYLEGMRLFSTPAQFGGGKDKAKPVFQRSVTLFSTKEDQPFHPKWGKKEAADMLAKCM